VIQVHRVVRAFEAKQLHFEPLRVGIFIPGDLLIVLSSEDSYTLFCRHDESIELGKRAQFTIGDWEFAECTEIEGGAEP
jgi:hypothetical protein